MRLARRLTEEFDTDVCTGDILRWPTIEQQAQFLTSENSTDDAVADAAKRAGRRRRQRRSRR